MKRLTIVLFGLLTVVTAGAQFDPQMGQYMYLPTAYNPAAVGEGDLMKVAGMHRMQYVDISNAPMSTWFSFCSPLNPTFTNPKSTPALKYPLPSFCLYAY